MSDKVTNAVSFSRGQSFKLGYKAELGTPKSSASPRSLRPPPTLGGLCPNPSHITARHFTCLLQGETGLQSCQFLQRQLCSRQPGNKNLTAAAAARRTAADGSAERANQPAKSSTRTWCNYCTQVSQEPPPNPSQLRALRQCCKK